MLLHTLKKGLFSLTLSLVAIGFGRSAAAATVINYGNYTAPTAQVTFTQVTESSATDAVPLFGAPHVTGSALDFDPAGFAAVATGGSSDITDGQLDYGVTGGPGVGINSLTVNEGGDFSLTGIGTAATQTLAGVIFNIKITEVDGHAITPITFSQNASVGFNLIANPGLVQPWSMALTVPIAAELTALNIPYTVGATKLEVTMNNQLVAFSEPQSAAFIAKKDFVITAISDVTAPEPASATLLLIGGITFTGKRRRRTR